MLNDRRILAISTRMRTRSVRFRGGFIAFFRPMYFVDPFAMIRTLFSVRCIAWLLPEVYKNICEEGYVALGLVGLIVGWDHHLLEWLNLPRPCWETFSILN